MTIILNGEKKHIPEGLTVTGLLEHLDITPERVAVEINEEIVRKAAYGATAVQEGDRVEVVQFMGGGSAAEPRSDIHGPKGERGMEKKPFLNHWSKLRLNQPLRPKPVRYTHEGSTYAEDGIRITGSKAFVDSVLSRLKDLLRFESDTTRLQVVYKRSTDRESGKAISSYNCYVQVHARGGAPAKKKAKKKSK